MHLNPKDKLYGLPILEIRAVVRDSMEERLRGFDKKAIENQVAKRLEKSRPIAAEVMKSLIKDDYLVLEKEKYEDSYLYKLKPTDKGRRFGVALANPPISRQKADQLLKELIERAKIMNASKEYLYRVDSIKVFGSYLSEKAVLGDLDVAVKVSQILEGEEFTKANFKRVELAIKNGKVFRSFIDQISWPYEEVMLMLKSRKKGLSIHDEILEDVIRLTETRTVYEYES